MDGQTLVAFLKRVPELKNIPIIAVTAWPEDKAREMANAYGCDDFISKPINIRTFPDQIAKYLPQTWDFFDPGLSNKILNYSRVRCRAIKSIIQAKNRL